MTMIVLWNILFISSWAFAESTPKATEAAASSGNSINILESVMAANIIVQLAFLILIVMSIVSWAIILQKWIQIKKTDERNSHLKDVFLKATSFEEIYSVARTHDESPLAQIFISTYDEMKKSISSKGENEKKPLMTAGVDNIERSLRQSTDNEIARLESGLGFLATTGSSCPFIGLFGTVFGIMNSFNQIAASGSASLNVVAPGIAEALLATGVGLFAAIPASIFFNYFLGQLKRQELICNNFSTDFLNIAKRNFFKNQPGL